MFRKIRGQTRAIQLLNNAISHDRIAQAYLFHGREGVGKFMTAFYFGMALNCLSSSEYRPCGVCASCHKFLAFEHPDFIYLFPTPNYKISPTGEIKDGSSLKEYEAYLSNKRESPWKTFFFPGSTEIRKESIMMLQHRLNLSIHEAAYRICLIEDADQMNQATANAFLKTLEEPPQRTVIILVTQRLSVLLPTIVSRCQLVYFNPLPRSVMESILIESFAVDPPTARTASLIADGNLKTSIRIAQESSSENRELALKLLSLAAYDKELEFNAFLQKSRELVSGDYLVEVINHLAIFVNDLALLSTHSELLTNIDQISLLTDIATRSVNLGEGCLEVLLTFEDLKRKIAGHVNSSLILIKIYFTLRKLFLPPSP
ncbi:MAG: DNA polymerase III subunit [Candidatus Cloacimonetes bacterium]|nr:DNA polymerase III subunit [Candidatus Cloacimonadota bacterium]